MLICSIYYNKNVYLYIYFHVYYFLKNVFFVYNLTNSLNRTSTHGVQFKDAIENCLTKDPESFGPGLGLFRVGQLRKLRNLRHHDHLPHLFRVDAVKDYEVKLLQFFFIIANSFNYSVTDLGEVGKLHWLRNLEKNDF